MQPALRLFLCGDVMLGRGIDQVMAHPCDPALQENYARSAMDYVGLAEEANGPIPRAVAPGYVWGAALDELQRARPDARIVNLETSVTRSDDFAPKGINYRMSPENADCLAAAGIDCCVLANNHVLDFGQQGLLDTLEALQRQRIKIAGAGRNLAEAAAPAALDIPGKGRVLVFSLALTTSGTPRSWGAKAEAPGVNVLSDLSESGIARLCGHIARLRQPQDTVVVSVHWGPNWGYEIPAEQRRLAHALIDKAGASVVHGHSSHHAKAVEVYRNRLILYGCGDFLNDYEGIKGYEEYRDDLAVMYFVDIDPVGKDAVALDLVPLQLRRFRLVPPSATDVEWLRQTLDRECGRFGARVVETAEKRLALLWPRAGNRGLQSQPGASVVESN